jgi:hypothetical protein
MLVINILTEGLKLRISNTLGTTYYFCILYRLN